MKKRGNTQNILIIALSIVVIAMSIGFAAIERDLQITGTVNLTGNVFQVQFQDNSYDEVENSVQATSATLSGLSGTYTVTLAKPGDFYEFTGVIENVGNFDASLTEVTLTNSLTAEQQKYITYTVTYDSTSYTQTTTGITGVTLSHTTGSNTVPIRVRVLYNVPTVEADLLTSNLSGITLGVTFHFVQV